MTIHPILSDHRHNCGHIWNVKEVVEKWQIGHPGDPWNSADTMQQEQWIDRFVYTGFSLYGTDFMNSLDGRFGVAYFDAEREVVFLARDWMGEVPLHYCATSSRVFVANTVAELREATEEDYQYEYVRSSPHGCIQEICIGDALTRGEIDGGLWDSCHRYFDFHKAVEPYIKEAADRDLSSFGAGLRTLLLQSVAKRLEGSQKMHLLLSGGLDSLTILTVGKILGIEIHAHTLATDSEGDDVKRAAHFAHIVQCKHTVHHISPQEVTSAAQQAVSIAEDYHLFNIFCAVPMLILGGRLKEMGISTAYCGEGVNEAVGDYDDWIVWNPHLQRDELMQALRPLHLEQPQKRASLCVGGNEFFLKYNRQLGAGLAKHAVSRMVKPFAHWGLQLECPYFSRELLLRLVGIPARYAGRGKAKAALVWQTYGRDMVDLGITESEVYSAAKNRFQDGTGPSRRNMTTLLLKMGIDQRQALVRFNQEFGARLDVDRECRRLTPDAVQSAQRIAGV